MMTEALSHLVLSVVSHLFWGYVVGFALIALSIVAERIAYPPQRANKRKQ